MLVRGTGIVQAQTVTAFSAGITAGAQPYSITAGSDGNHWLTEFFATASRTGRITPGPVGPLVAARFVPTLQRWALGMLLLIVAVGAARRR